MPSLRRVPPPLDFAALATRPSVRSVRTEADVRCYHCSQLCGVVEFDQHGSLPEVARVRAVGADPDSAVAAPWRRLRCSRCAGPLFLDEPRRVRQYDDHVNWALDQPRRGRPPQWLVDLRRQSAA